MSRAWLINSYIMTDYCPYCQVRIPKTDAVRHNVCNRRLRKNQRRNKNPIARLKAIKRQRLIRKYGTCVL